MAITRRALRIALHRLDRTVLHPFDVRDLADELLQHQKRAREEALAARLRMPWTPGAPCIGQPPIVRKRPKRSR